jgi:hypothetical protein
MKRVTSSLISFILAGAVVVCLQTIFIQRSALARSNDLPAAAQELVVSTAPITFTSSYTVYLPLIFRPSAYIAGRVVDNGTPVASVTISTNGGHTTTDANGHYQLYLPNGTYTVTPSLADYTFTPPYRLVTLPPTMSSLDFAAAPPPPCAAGTTIFFDNFSNSSSGWGQENTTRWYLHYIDGEYESVLKVKTQLLRGAPGVAGNAGSFVVSDSMRQIDAPENGDGYGLWIGSPNLGKYYEFSVSTSTQVPAAGNFAVTYFDGIQSTWIAKASGTSSAVNMGNGVNVLRVHRCGTRYFFFANNTLLTTVILPELANQPLTAGFYARANSNATYRLDNFRIQTAP